MGLDSATVRRLVLRTVNAEQPTRSRGAAALGDRLAELGVDQGAAARAVGKSRATLCYYISGQRKPRNTPDDPTQSRIKELWGIPLDWWSQPAVEPAEETESAA